MVDLDEVAPNTFVIRNNKARAILRGEGLISGATFLLQTTRREGWVARVRMSGFQIRTIADRIAALPALPSVVLGPEIWLPLPSPKDQIAVLDPVRLRWRDVMVIEQGGGATPQRGVRVAEYSAIRRRKSRNGGDFFQVLPGQRGATLQPIDESAALLLGFAAQGQRPRLAATVAGGDLVVAGQDIVLPAQHAEVLGFLAQPKTRWRFAPDARALAAQLFATLGVVLAAPAEAAP